MSSKLSSLPLSLPPSASPSAPTSSHLRPRSSDIDVIDLSNDDFDFASPPPPPLPSSSSSWLAASTAAASGLLSAADAGPSILMQQSEAASSKRKSAPTKGAKKKKLKAIATATGSKGGLQHTTFNSEDDTDSDEDDRGESGHAADVSMAPIAASSSSSHPAPFSSSLLVASEPPSSARALRTRAQRKLESDADPVSDDEQMEDAADDASASCPTSAPSSGAFLIIRNTPQPVRQLADVSRQLAARIERAQSDGQANAIRRALRLSQDPAAQRVANELKAYTHPTSASSDRSLAASSSSLALLPSTSSLSLSAPSSSLPLSSLLSQPSPSLDPGRAIDAAVPSVVADRAHIRSGPVNKNADALSRAPTRSAIPEGWGGMAARGPAARPAVGPAVSAGLGVSAGPAVAAPAVRAGPAAVVAAAAAIPQLPQITAAAEAAAAEAAASSSSSSSSSAAVPATPHRPVSTLTTWVAQPVFKLFTPIGATPPVASRDGLYRSIELEFRDGHQSHRLLMMNHPSVQELYPPWKDFNGFSEADKSDGATYTCSICTCVARDASVLTCNHMFCKSCIKKWCNTKQPATCPNCRNPITTAVDDIVSNVDMNQAIANLQVPCINRSFGCQWMGAIGLNRCHLRDHLDCCDHTCPFCRAPVPPEEKAKHLETCPQRLVECVHCNAEMTLCQLITHQDVGAAASAAASAVPHTAAAASSSAASSSAMPSSSAPESSQAAAPSSSSSSHRRLISTVPCVGMTACAFSCEDPRRPGYITTHRVTSSHRQVCENRPIPCEICGPAAGTMTKSLLIIHIFENHPESGALVNRMLDQNDVDLS